MRFPYVALAIKPNANEMYMQRKWFYLYYNLFFIIIKYFGGQTQMLCTFSPNMFGLLIGIKSLVSVPNADCDAFSDPTQL